MKRKFHDGAMPLSLGEQEVARLRSERQARKRCTAAMLARFMLENPQADVKLVSPDAESAREFLDMIKEAANER